MMARTKTGKGPASQLPLQPAQKLRFRMKQGLLMASLAELGAIVLGYCGLHILAVHPLFRAEQTSLLIPYKFFQKHLRLPALRTLEHRCGWIP